MMRSKKIIAAMAVVILAAAAIIPISVQPDTVSAVSPIGLNKKSAVIKVGKTVQLKVKGTNKKVKWSSSNTYVAKVTSKGKVTGKHAGSAKITAKIGSKKLTCKIRVKEKEEAIATGVPSLPTRIPTGTETPFIPTRIPSETEHPILPEISPKPVTINTSIPAQTPGKQVDLALNFYLSEYDPDAPSEQFVTVHLINHLAEDVYVETEAYLTTRGKDYPAMILGSKEGDLEQVEPTYEEDTYGKIITYDSKEYVMGNYTDETFWLTSDENSTLTFYFRIGTQRYRATINYNETGAVFREATAEETLQPVVTEKPVVSEVPIVTKAPILTEKPVETLIPEERLEAVEMPFQFCIQVESASNTSEECFCLDFDSREAVNIKVEKGAIVTTNGKSYPLYAWSEETLSLAGEELTYYRIPLWTRSIQDHIEYGPLYVPYDHDHTTVSFYFVMDGIRYKAEAKSDKNACKYYKVN